MAEGTVTVNAALAAALGSSTIALQAKGKFAGAERIIALPVVTLTVVPPALVELAGPGIEVKPGAIAELKGKIVRKGGLRWPRDRQDQWVTGGIEGGTRHRGQGIIELRDQARPPTPRPPLLLSAARLRWLFRSIRKITRFHPRHSRSKLWLPNSDPSRVVAARKENPQHVPHCSWSHLDVSGRGTARVRDSPRRRWGRLGQKSRSATTGREGQEGAGRSETVGKAAQFHARTSRRSWLRIASPATTPRKSESKYVMTTFAQLAKGGQQNEGLPRSSRGSPTRATWPSRSEPTLSLGCHTSKTLSLRKRSPQSSDGSPRAASTTAARPPRTGPSLLRKTRTGHDSRRLSRHGADHGPRVQPGRVDDRGIGLSRDHVLEDVGRLDGTQADRSCRTDLFHRHQSGRQVAGHRECATRVSMESPNSGWPSRTVEASLSATSSRPQGRRLRRRLQPRQQEGRHRGCRPDHSHL